MPWTFCLQGCGRAAALKFADKGYNVVVAARAPERLQAVAEEIMQKNKNKEGAGDILEMLCDYTFQCGIGNSLFHLVTASPIQLSDIR